MTPVRSIKNRYRGINAHLHSLWQGEGGWNSFHSSHIIHLMTVMKAQLRPMGYTADVQQSLQIRRYEEPAGKPESDVTIYDLDPSRVIKQSVSGGARELVLPIPQMLGLSEPTERQFGAIAIYKFEWNRSDQGEPVAWVELLSPSNKPGGQDAEYYHDKRLKLLQTGMVFVEIDYLHESPPALSIPTYRIRRTGQLPQPGSHPYRIAVIDPRPVFMEGLGHIAEFDVDEPIPSVEIPLNAGDIFEFDFGIPYQKTFEEAFYGDNVDYTQLPPNFDRYSPDDQMRIAARMLAVLEAARDGVDLETGPFPVKPIASLDEALGQINVLVGQHD